MIQRIKISNFSSCSLPIVSIRIGDIMCNALIDTGATLNILSSSILKKLTNIKEIDAPPIELKTINGVSVATHRVIECNVEIGKSNFLAHMVTTNNDLSPSFDVILGLNFLNMHNFIIDCTANCLRNSQVEVNWNFSRVFPQTCGYSLEHNFENLQNRENSSFKEVNENDHSVYNCDVTLGRVFSKVTIPPLSQRYVDIKLDNPTINALSSSKPLLIEKEKNSLSTSFLVSRSVSHLSKSSTCLALVLNLNDTPLTLNKGMVIANVSPIHEFASIENVNCVSSGNSNDNKNWLKEIKLNHLTSSQQQQVLELLNKYNNVFAQNISDLGECGIIKHTIQLTDDIPTRQKPYRVPYNLKNEMKNQINILLDAGIIQPSTSPYCAPVLLVKKSDGSFRLVADLRKLNSKTIPDNFPLPKIDEMIDQLSGAKFFSTMDLTSGFHQMSMHPDHMHYTGIATEFGLFEYKRLPFGLKNASASFQRLMSIVLAGLSDLQIACYIDDVIIASHNFQDHLQRLELVFQRLTAANLKVKPSKCSFLQFEISFLGHTVREGQVLPDPKNLDSIKNTMPPRTKKQVRSFLGLTGFYRKFIPNYSKKAIPLTNLTKETSKFTWSEKEQLAFDSLKNCLISEPCLSLPDFSKPFALCSDASKFSLGAVLIQEDDTGFQHPVAFASRKLGPTEIKYSVCEKEALGILFAITHFKNYIYGSEFIVYCDQQSLSRIKTLKDPSSRISRWFLTLQEYSYKIIHKPGRLNHMADYLSRARYPNEDSVSITNIHEVHALNSNCTEFNLSSFPIEELIAKQNSDSYCNNIKSKLESNFQFSPKSPKFFLKNDLLLYYRENTGRHDSKAKLVVPQSLVQNVLQLCHDNNSVAHSGLSRTLKRVKVNYFWHGLYHTVKQYIASCHSCIQRRGFAKTSKAPVQRIPTTDFPFQKCAFDAVGPLVTSTFGNKFIIVISDYFTRYAEAYPVPNIQSSTVARVLLDFISRHGIMETLYSDRGSNFLSEAMMEVYQRLGISKRHTLSFNPQGNGLVERLNKTLIDTLSHLVSETQEDWCQHLPLALMAFRNAYHRTVEETPAFLLYGRDPVMPYDLIFSDPVRTYSDTPSYAQQLVNRLQSTYTLVKNNLEKSADEIQKHQKPFPKSKQICVGNLVYLHTPKIKLHTSKKLAKQNQGPFRVVKQNSLESFEIQHINQPSNKQTVHVNRLVKVVERDTFPCIQDSSKNHCSSSHSLERQPDEDETSKLYPPYTLPYK
ncbi:Retrovirus-related Pol polyprotein from transposon 297, partial [Araneus ventricosus]